MRLVRQALSIVLILSISGIPAMAGTVAGRAVASQPSQALAQLTELNEELQATLAPAVRELQQALNDAVNAEPNGSRIKGGIGSLHSALQKLRHSFVRTAGKIAPFQQLHERYVLLVTRYFELVGMLVAATESFPAFAGLNLNELRQGLDLCVPDEVEESIRNAMGAIAVQNKLDVFDTELVSSRFGNGLKCVWLSARHMAMFRMKAYIRYPDAKTIEKPLVFEALKIGFARQAMHNSYLFSDEKQPAPLPAGVDPLLSVFKDEAGALSREALFRRYLLTMSAQRLAETPVPEQAEFQGVARDSIERAASALGGALNTAVMGAALKLPASLIQYIDSLEGERRTEFIVGAFSRSGAFDLMAAALTKGFFEQREAVMKGYISTRTGRLVDLSRDDLSGLLLNALRELLAESFIVGSFGKNLVSLNELSEPDAIVLIKFAQELVGQLVRETPEFKAAIDELISVKDQPDLLVAFRRYALAKDLLVSAEELERLEDEYKRVEFRVRSIPIQDVKEMFPDPNPGLVLRATKLGRDLPAWIDEMIQGYATVSSSPGGGEQVPPEKLQQIRAQVPQVPGEVYQVASSLKRLVGAGAIADLESTHKGLLANRTYAWLPLEQKARALRTRVKTPEARRFIEKWLELRALADIAQSPGLEGKAMAIFEQTLTGEITLQRALGLELGRTTELDALIKEARLAASAIGSKGWELTQLFSSTSQRNAYLWKLLRDPTVYRGYLSLKTEALITKDPALSAEIRLPSKVRAQTVAHPVKLYDLIRGMRRALDGSSIPHLLGKKAVESLRADRLRRGEGLNDRIRVDGLEPLSVVAGAARKMTKSSSFWDSASEYLVDLKLSMDRIKMKREAERKQRPQSGQGRGFGDVDLVIDRLILAHAKLDEADRAAPTDDRHWKTELLGRDVLPAYFDNDIPKNQLAYRVKAERILTALFLSPYMQSAAMAGKNEQALLLDPSVDHITALLQSKAYKNLVAGIGGAIAGGLSDVEKEVFGFREFWRTFKTEITSKTQAFAHAMFMGSIYLNYSRRDHAWVGNIMFLSAFPDFLADGALLMDYWDTYFDLLPYSQSGMLGMETVAYTEHEKIRHDMISQMRVMGDRAIMDVFFFSGFIRGWSYMGKQAFQNLKAGKRLANHWPDTKAAIKFRDRCDEVGTALYRLNVGENRLHPFMPPETFHRLYNARVKEIRHKARTDARLAEELEDWKHARKLIRELEQDHKYVLDDMAKRATSPKIRGELGDGKPELEAEFKIVEREDLGPDRSWAPYPPAGTGLMRKGN